MSEENRKEAESEEEIKKRKEEWTKKHGYGLPVWLKDKDFPSIAPEVAEALDIEQPQIPQVVPDRIYIKTLIRAVNAMKILKFLFDRDDAFYEQQIADGVGLNTVTVGYNLRKLEKAGLAYSKKYLNLNKQTLYFCLINKKVAELVLKQYYWHTGFELGHYVPYDKVTVKQLKTDSRFIEDCKKYGLTLDEAIDIVKKCPKIEVEYGKGYTLLSRREQGYIQPEPKQKATEVVEEPEKEPVEVM